MLRALIVALALLAGAEGNRHQLRHRLHKHHHGKLNLVMVGRASRKANHTTAQAVEHADDEEEKDEKKEDKKEDADEDSKEDDSKDDDQDDDGKDDADKTDDQGKKDEKKEQKDKDSAGDKDEKADETEPKEADSKPAEPKEPTKLEKLEAELKEAEREHQHVLKEINSFEDEVALNAKMLEAVTKIENETNAPHLAQMLGSMRRDMWTYASPFYRNQILEGRKKESEAKVAKIKGEIAAEKGESVKPKKAEPESEPEKKKKEPTIEKAAKENKPVNVMAFIGIIPLVAVAVYGASAVMHK